MLSQTFDTVIEDLCEVKYEVIKPNVMWLHDLNSSPNEFPSQWVLNACWKQISPMEKRMCHNKNDFKLSFLVRWHKTLFAGYWIIASFARWDIPIPKYKLAALKIDIRYFFISFYLIYDTLCIDDDRLTICCCSTSTKRKRNRNFMLCVYFEIKYQKKI